MILAMTFSLFFNYPSSLYPMDFADTRTFQYILREST
jgi:hypothetical protein